MKRAGNNNAWMDVPGMDGGAGALEPGGGGNGSLPSQQNLANLFGADNFPGKLAGADGYMGKMQPNDGRSAQGRERAPSPMNVQNSQLPSLSRSVPEGGAEPARHKSGLSRNEIIDYMYSAAERTYQAFIAKHGRDDQVPSNEPPPEADNVAGADAADNEGDDWLRQAAREMPEDIGVDTRGVLSDSPLLEQLKGRVESIPDFDYQQLMGSLPERPQHRQPQQGDALQMRKSGGVSAAQQAPQQFPQLPPLPNNLQPMQDKRQYMQQQQQQQQQQRGRGGMGGVDPGDLLKGAEHRSETSELNEIRAKKKSRKPRKTAED